MTNYIAHPREPSRGVDDEHDLVDHLNGVSDLSVYFASRFMDTTENLKVSARLHDLGKANQNFYNYLCAKYPTPPGSFEKPGRHQRISALIAQDMGYEGPAYVIDHHHGGYYDYSPRYDTGAGNYMDRMKVSRASISRGTGRKIQRDVDTQWYRESEAWLHTCIQNGDLELPDVAEVVAESKSLHSKGMSRALWFRMLQSCLVDADRLDTAYHGSPDTFASRYLSFQADDLKTLSSRSKNHFDNLVGKAPKTAINLLRDKIHRRALTDVTQAPGFFDLEVPTGGGKTMTAARFAIEHAKHHDLDRVFFLVPYLSVLEQNVSVYRDLFDTAQEMNVLEHHSNFSMENFLHILDRRKVSSSDQEEYLERHEGSIENWDMPVVVTTTVQFFETLYKNWTSRLRRLHRIPKSVIVIDEYQTLPYNLLKPIVAGLEELVKHYGCSVVFSSATSSQRYWVRENLLSNPPHLLSDPGINNAAPLQRVTFTYDPDQKTWPEMAQKINAINTSSLNILNLKTGCREILPFIRDRKALFHLSSALIPAHRSDVVQTLHKRLAQGKKTTVVATPVVRAGVDLDFPEGYVQLSGIDSILQVAGRINREGNLPHNGVLHVFDTEENRKFPSRHAERAQQTAAFILANMVNGDLTSSEVQAYYSKFYATGNNKQLFDSPEEGHTPVMEADSKLALRTSGRSFR